MKRILTLLMVIMAAVVMYVPVANADVVWRTEPIKWRLKRSAVNAAQWDSTEVHRAGARVDTSVAFSLPNRAYPTAFNTGALNDSVPAFAVSIVSTKTDQWAAAAGSTKLTVQGSMNGEDWTSLWAQHTLTAVQGANYWKSYSSGVISPMSAVTDQSWLLCFKVYRIILDSAATGAQYSTIGFWATREARQN